VSQASGILTTHVGSLVRPPALRAILERRRDGQPYDEAEYEETLRQSVIDVVRKQAETGIDIVSDGEYGKGIHWAAYVNERISGMEWRAELLDPTRTQHSTDAIEFPEFYERYMLEQGIEPRGAGGWIVTGPLSYTGQDQLHRDIRNLTAGLEQAGVTGGFLPVVAPASVSGIEWKGVYGSDEEFAFAVADVLRVEYQAILDAGLTLQVDDAFLPWTYDLMVPPATMDDYRKWAQVRVDALNHALRGLDTGRIRYHICWGSFNTPHLGDVPARDIIDLVLQVNAGAYLIEMANPRHEHEWRLWGDVKLPEGRTLIPGVISHSTNVVEHPELVAERLERLAALVGAEHLRAGTDCGFAQGPFVARVHESIQWAKLRAMVEGARLASGRLLAAS